MGLSSGIGDWYWGFGIGILDKDCRLGIGIGDSYWGLGLGIEIWDWGLGLRIGDWDWGGLDPSALDPFTLAVQKFRLDVSF